jgi:uncharacterized integral membrane protein
MSTQHPAPAQPPGGSGPGPEKAAGAVKRLGAKQIVFILLALYALLLALFNLDSVKVNFVFFSTRASLFVVIVLAAAIGFLAGYLFDGLRVRRRARRASTT